MGRGHWNWPLSWFQIFEAIRIDIYVTLHTGKECGQPGEPANGSLLSSEILFYPGEEAVYSCRPGYVLAGSERRVCGEDGVWSGALPTCSEYHGRRSYI